jgi:Tfp pilus assembly PilM family ATPase
MPASGIDISDQSLRYLELEKTKQGLHIKRYGSQGFPEGLVVEGKIENTAGLIVELQKLKEETGIDFVRVSLPEEQAYLFQTVVPVLDEKQNLRSMIEFQLEEHVPIPSEGAVFDYEIIKRLENGEIEVNVAVYGTDVIAAYLEVLKGARLTPLSFEVESQAIARAVLPQRDMGTYMLVDFGYWHYEWRDTSIHLYYCRWWCCVNERNSKIF